MVKLHTYPKRFEIYWVALDPTFGSEVRKTRPCVVITPDTMNKFLDTVIVAPMTTTRKKWTCRVNLNYTDKNGQIMLEQMRVVDKGRLHKLFGIVPELEQTQIIEALEKIFCQ
jgi:mRNA interferase MazF